MSVETFFNIVIACFVLVIVLAAGVALVYLAPTVLGIFGLTWIPLVIIGFIWLVSKIVTIEGRD